MTNRTTTTQDKAELGRPPVIVRRKLGWYSGIFILLFALGGISFLVSTNVFSSAVANDLDDSMADRIRKLPVNVELVKFVDYVDQKRTYTGVLRARQQADLGFELAGRVESVLVDEGDFVTAGQPLAKLDIATLAARRQATIASIAQAKAVLDELEAGPRVERIETVRAQLNEAKSNLDLSKLNFQRRRELFKTSAVSLEEFDRSKFSYFAATARLDSVRKQLEELEAGTRQEKINAQSAFVEQLRATLDELDVQIQKSTILAPFSGKIVSRMIDSGTISMVSTPIFKIVDVENLEALIGVPVEKAQSIDEGNDHPILVDGLTYPARLKAKIQQLDSATRTQNLIFDLDDYSNGRVIPGQLCQIELTTRIESKGCWIPASALTNGIRGLWSLLIVDEESSRSKRIDVEVLYTDGDRVLVRGTIVNGAKVIVDGTHRIVEGQLVQAVPSE